LAIAAAAIGVLAATGRDAYPELYAISLANIDRIERWRQRRDAGLTRNAKRLRSRPTSVSLPAPAGVLVFVWKSVVEFTRRATPLAIGRGALLWCVAGFAVARAIAPDPDMLFIALTIGSSYLILVVGVAATSTLAGEIRRPVFWLASTPLFERLCSLALARMWRSILTLELVALGFALGGGTSIDTLVLAIELPAVVALLTSVGFVAFALLPSSADARGPVTLLRFGLSLVLVVPPLVLGGVAAMVAGSLPALGGAAFLALCEAGALIGIAAWRLDGHTERLAG
jgi:hypothetical protein